MNLELRQITLGSPEHRSEIELRTKVLREPLGLEFTPKELAKEEGDVHLGAFIDGRLVGCLLLSPQSGSIVKMRQVAVANEVQGQGIGKKLVNFSEKFARNRGYGEIILNARDTAVPFYLRLGYEVYDEPFIEVTIPHRKMRKRLG